MRPIISLLFMKVLGGGEAACWAEALEAKTVARKVKTRNCARIRVPPCCRPCAAVRRKTAAAADARAGQRRGAGWRRGCDVTWDGAAAGNISKFSFRSAVLLMLFPAGRPGAFASRSPSASSRRRAGRPWSPVILYHNAIDRDLCGNELILELPTKSMPRRLIACGPCGDWP